MENAEALPKKKTKKYAYYLQLTVIVFFALVILVGGHALVYFSAINFFSIASSHLKHLIAYSLLFLGASFFLSTLLAHWRENIFTRAYYYLSCFWIGLLNSLLLSLVAVSLILFATSYLYPTLHLAVLGIAAPILAFLYSIYGTWNARLPRIKKLEIPIPDIPEFWKGKKIIQLSDIHLGHIRSENYFKKIIELTNKQKPDLVVITGDLFDGMDGNLANLSKLADELESREGIYFITGNHETYLGTELVIEALAKTKIKHFHDAVVDLNGLKLIMVDYPDLNEKKNLPSTLENLKSQFFGQPNILLCHSPVSVREAKGAGVNLMLSGHTHRGQLFPFGYVTRLAFGGYDYGLHQIEDFYLYTTSGVGTWGPPMRTGNHPEIVSIILR